MTNFNNNYFIENGYVYRYDITGEVICVGVVVSNIDGEHIEWYE